MDNDKKLFVALLKADGIDPSGPTESERLAFAKMLDRQLKPKQTNSGSLPDFWRKIMKNKLTKLAAAALIIIAAMLAVHYSGGSIDGTSVAWANVVNPILNARTVSFDAVLKFGDQPEQKSHFDCFIPNRFVQKMSDGITNIVNYSEHEVLVLDTNTRIAEIKNLEDNSSEISLCNIFVEIQNLIKQTTASDDNSVTLLGKRDINGQQAIGFQIPMTGRGIIPGWYGKGTFTVWSQPETNLPLQLEWDSHMTGLKIVVNNLAINDVMDDSLFSLEIPTGYELKASDKEQSENLASDAETEEPDESLQAPSKMDEPNQSILSSIILEKQIEIPEELLLPAKNTEQKIINCLWSWTILTKGLFPSSLSADAIKDADPNASISFEQKGWGLKFNINLTSMFSDYFAFKKGLELTKEENEQLIQKHGPVYERCQEQLHKRLEEIEPLFKAIGDGFLVVFQMPADSNWHYAGKNIEFGNADAAIFWYKPKDSKTYRVIYGDLSVKDVAKKDLPK